MSTATPAKKPAASKKPRPKPSHPKWNDMILAVLADLQKANRSGVSRQKLAAAITAKYSVSNPTQLKMALKRMTAKNLLLHTKGIGASGSFKINKEAVQKPKPKPKPKKQVKKKTTTKSPKKKTTKPKKTTTTKKTTKPSTPKKAGAKKPKAAAKPKTAAKKPAAKKPAAKKPAAKKPAAKKPAAKKPAAKKAAPKK